MKRKPRLFFLIPVAIVAYFVVATWSVVHHAQLGVDLIAAVKTDNTSAALAALDAGADPNVRDHRRNVNYWWILRGGAAQDKTIEDHFASPLQIALNAEIVYGMGPGKHRFHQENVALIKALLDHGADPNGTAEQGTPLMRAAEFGCSSTIKMLLDKGADMNKQDYGGMTALHFAVLVPKAESVRLLLEKGANPDVKNKAGQTPRAIAALSRSKEIQELLRQARRKG